MDDEFKILAYCNICGESFDSNYKLMKHMSNSHFLPVYQNYNIHHGNNHGNCGCSHAI